MRLYETSEPIMKRLAILKAHCPKVTMMWSHGPEDSVQIIKKLKEDKANLDLARAEKLGKTGTVTESPMQDTICTGEDQANTNYFPLEMLKKFDNISEDTIHEIQRKVKNIYELATLPLTKLQEIVGTIAGESIFKFLHEEAKSEQNVNPELE